MGKAIREWPIPKNANKVRSFHGLASFHRRFVKNFSSLTAPLNELVKKNTVFKLIGVHEKTFNLLKDKLANECDDPSVRTRVVLMQDSKLVAYFSEKLHGQH